MREVCVRREVDKYQVNDELYDLHYRDVLFPPNADASSSLEIIPVHHDVNHEVEGDRHPGDGSIAQELSET